ncbi:MAG: anthranilate phosphoribosyltransferase, partial [Betaproteobacteria bacterium]|nr:anthranilate phosphoribosyltransferase [Betaproteobacteria bacterium]
NAGVALYAANVAASMQEGLALAQSVIASGQAKAKMRDFIAYSKTFATA